MHSRPPITELDLTQLLRNHAGSWIEKYYPALINSNLETSVSSYVIRTNHNGRNPFLDFIDQKHHKAIGSLVAYLYAWLEVYGRIYDINSFRRSNGNSAVEHQLPLFPLTNEY